MRIRSRLASRVPLDMTPMIDIVFQLLVFFTLTLRIASLSQTNL
jgi:biopolymer transport protein ExbD